MLVYTILPNQPALGPPGNTLLNLGIGPVDCASLSQNYGHESAILSRRGRLPAAILRELKDATSGR